MDLKQIQKKQKYVVPAIEVIKMEIEGEIMTLSGTSITSPGLNSGGNGWGNTSKAKGYQATTSNDIENMINDILTIEK